MNDSQRSARPTKTHLFRVKVMAVALSGMAFIGSLAGVALAHPATRSTPVVQQAAITRPSAALGRSGSGSLIAPTRPPSLNVRPLTRSRGS